MDSTRKLERSLGKLLKALAARCRGRTAICGMSGDRLAAAVRERGLEAVEVDPRGLGAPPAGGGGAALADGSFGSVVLAGVLERLGEEAIAPLLARAWALLKPGGRLIACVPNEGCPGGAPAAREWDRKRLKRLLKPLRRPRLATDQPYRWLVLYSDKPRGARRKLNRTRLDRYKVTVRLCRGKVIELGCGEGQLTAMIRARGHEVVGVDISGEKVRRAREEHTGITFIESDIRALDLPDGGFDTVVIAEVLEHVDEGAGAEILARARRLLRPRGRLIASVPNEDCIPHPNHVRLFDRKGLRRLLSPFGKPRLVTEQPFKWLLMYVDLAR